LQKLSNLPWEIPVGVRGLGKIAKKIAEHAIFFDTLFTMPKALRYIKRVCTAHRVYNSSDRNAEDAIVFTSTLARAKRVLREEHRQDATDVGQHDAGWLGLYNTLFAVGVNVTEIVDPYIDNVLKPEKIVISSDDDDDDNVPLARAATIKEVLQAATLDGAPPRAPAAKRAGKKSANPKPKPKPKGKAKAADWGAPRPPMRASAGCAYLVRPKPDDTKNMVLTDDEEARIHGMLDLMNSSADDKIPTEEKKKNTKARSEFSPSPEASAEHGDTYINHNDETDPSQFEFELNF